MHNKSKVNNHYFYCRKLKQTTCYRIIVPIEFLTHRTDGLENYIYRLYCRIGSLFRPFAETNQTDLNKKDLGLCLRER
jgi:hypothetical protein